VFAISFSNGLKSELMSLTLVPGCCDNAQTYGLVLFSRSFSLREISFFSENSDLADLYAKSVGKLVSPGLQYRTTKKKNYVISLDSQKERSDLLRHFGHDDISLHLRINRANLPDDCCYSSFVRGAFLACGTISSPYKAYHLEFVVPSKKLCDDLSVILAEIGFPPKYVQRKGSNVLYYKDSGLIEYLLVYMGAEKSALELMGVKIDRDLKNNANRIMNFDMANIERTLKASRQQVEAIMKIQSKIGLESLPKNLQEIARLRLENPELNLNDLGELLEKPISRSGINNRLNTIIRIAEELE
jgi:hypothetical protein